MKETLISLTGSLSYALGSTYNISQNIIKIGLNTDAHATIDSFRSRKERNVIQRWTSGVRHLEYSTLREKYVFSCSK